MAASSKYLQLSSSVLMEYQYADQSNLAAHQRLTSVANLWKMVNAHTGVDYIMNDDNSKSITGNVRDRSAVLIDPAIGKYAYLNIDGINVYNDIDDNLTSLGDLSINPSVPGAIVYDKVKLHFTQGFNFEQKEGLIIEISAETAQSKKMILASQAYIEEDTYAQLNSAPFLFGGKSYTSYIEFEVPALYNLIDDYRNDYAIGGNPDIGAYLISPVGYNTTTPIDIKFGFIDEVTVVNGNKFFSAYYHMDTVLSKTDQFTSITASVAEASDGDYYELQPLSNGSNAENFILGLNNDGGDYIILHDIAVFEQLPGGGFVKTQDMQIAQIDEFDQPITFRPVVMNGSVAVSYRLDYVVRLYNRNDNTQIWKVASITNMDTKKYAKNLNKLNIGSNPVIANVYNDIIQKTLNLSNINTADVSLTKSKGYTKYITSFINTAHIHLSSDIVYQKVINGTTVYVSNANAGPNDTAIMGQGELDMSIQHTDAFYKFVIYNDDRNGQKTQMDLDGIGELKLQFFVGAQKQFTINELSDSGANRSKGEVIFKIPADKSKELVNKKDQPLYIVAQPENGGPETVLYQSIFTGPGAEQRNNLLISRVQSLKNRLVKKTNKLKDAEDALIAQRNKEIVTDAYIQKSQQTMVTYQERITYLESQVVDLQNSIVINTPEVPDTAPVEDYTTEQQDEKKLINSTNTLANVSNKNTQSKQITSKTQKEKDLSPNRQNIKTGLNKWKK